jgi:diketogulonate reductase-like aldo/keto reductase
MKKQVTLPSGERVPPLGLGTWNMGDDAATRQEEIAALRLGIDLGATLIDTAEIYGDGRSEELIAEAIAGRHDEVFLVSKVYPHNATRRGIVAACERSLKRLQTDRIDLYLLHWRCSVPLAESLEALERAQGSGKIRHYGVSNLDLSDMQEAWGMDAGQGIATNQLLYNLSRRGIEWDLLPWLRERRIPVMAYSPVEQGRLLRNAELVAFARRRHITAAQVALAWLLHGSDVIVIPKSGRPEHVRENVAALDVTFTDEDLAELDAMYPPPASARALEML